MAFLIRGGIKKFPVKFSRAPTDGNTRLRSQGDLAVNFMRKWAYWDHCVHLASCEMCFFLWSGICCRLRFCQAKECSSVFSTSVVMCIDISTPKTRPSIERSTGMFWSVCGRTFGEGDRVCEARNIGLCTMVTHTDTALSSVISFLPKTNIILLLHPPYSTELIAAEFHRFSKMKMQLKLRSFHTFAGIQSE